VLPFLPKITITFMGFIHITSIEKIKVLKIKLNSNDSKKKSYRTLKAT